MTTTALDVHAGTSPAEHRATFAAVFADVVSDCERLGIRPTTVGVSSLFGLTSVAVGLPSEDTAAVDALGGLYGLPVDDATSDRLYLRSGLVDLDRQSVTVTVYTARPGAVFEPYPAAPETTPMPAVAPQPAGTTR